MLNTELLLALLSGFFAILGTVVGLIISQLLRNAGKLIVNINSCSIAERVDCSFEVEFFNSSDVPKSLRATALEFVPRNTKKSVLLPIHLHKKIIGNSPSYAFISEELHIINLPSKEMLHLKLKGYFKPEDVHLLQGKVDFFFQGKYPNGKIFRKKLITQDFNALSTPIVKVD